jgi:hypothetical protein
VIRKWIILLVAAAVLMPSISEGARIFEKVGTIGGQMLKIGIGARPAAMGEAFVAVDEDPISVFWNPAGIARLDGQALTFNHATWPADIRISQAAYVFSPGRRFPGKLAISARSLWMDVEPVRTPYRPQGTGEFWDAGEMALGVSYARAFTDKFAAGVTFNYFKSGLADVTAQTMTVDFGTMYNTGVRGFRIGIAIQNIGSDMEYSGTINPEGVSMDFQGERVKVPILFRVGSMLNLYQHEAHSIITAFDFTHPPDNAERASWGMEYGFNEYFFLRGGYKFNYDTEGLTAGMGIKFPTSIGSQSRLDYAYSDMETLGGSHRFSLTMAF